MADRAAVELYEGPKDTYHVDLDAAPTPGAAKKSSSKSKSSLPAYSYLSLVDGVLQTHKTWKECEARVKGVRGTKFKKSLSKEDEDAIKREWGV
jgi:hypothetical protein